MISVKKKISLCYLFFSPHLQFFFFFKMNSEVASVINNSINNLDDELRSLSLKVNLFIIVKKKKGVLLVGHYWIILFFFVLLGLDTW